MIKSQKKYSRIAVKAIFRSGDKVLYYKTKKGVRDLPGGHLHFGETLITALRRELKEEIGFQFELEPPLVYAWTYLSSDEERHEAYIGYLFDLSETISFRSKEYGDKIEFIWLDKSEIKTEAFLSGMEKALIKAAEYS
ncbi:NUDIX hydrolase [Patescibacteria group bacterium]|nr:NUDIX hydrolase [Patescibacteria group bacterium]MBU1074730.1 NUDIX hydrolase [Patescibacteria group bacterium]MBU1951755.1 NUDIX hydrolase [Patescibacteria group bacterium]